MQDVKIGDRLIGGRHPCYIIAEIGINHNGDLDIAKQLIDIAVAAGCDAVKFQKRTIEVVYTAEELAPPAGQPVRPDQWRLEARPGIWRRAICRHRRLLPGEKNRLVRQLLG